MRQNKTHGFATLVMASLVISACASTPAPAQTAGPDTVTGLAFNPADGSLWKTDAAGLSRLATNGQAWEAVRTPATSGLTGLALNPDDPTMLYVSGPSVGVLKSVDGGQTWDTVHNGLPDKAEIMALAMHSFRFATLYVWAKDAGIYRTEDGGEHWARMPDQGPPDSNVRALAHSTLPGSMNTGWLYASTPSGAYLSMDCF